MVRQFKPDPVGVTDTRDPVLAVALKRDAVAGGVTHPAQHIHPVTGAVCRAVARTSVTGGGRRIPGKASRRASGCSVHPCRTARIVAAAQNVLGVIRVNRRITVTVEGKSQRGSPQDDIHPVSLLTHSSACLPVSRPAHAGRQAMQRQYRTVERVKERGGFRPA